MREGRHRSKLSPHFSHRLCCIGEMIRPDCVARPASGYPSAVLNVLKSTFAGASVARLVRPVLSPLRDDLV